MKRCLALASVLLLAIGPTAPAALPPSCYPNPEHASEIVDIRVLSAAWLPRPFKSTPVLITWRVVALAKVTRVHATHTDLKPGAVITVSYDSEIPTVPLCGGFNCYPRLALGMQCRAHLCQETQWPRTYGPWGAPYSAFGAVHGEEQAKRSTSEGVEP